MEDELEEKLFLQIIACLYVLEASIVRIKDIKDRAFSVNFEKLVDFEKRVFNEFTSKVFPCFSKLNGSPALQNVDKSIFNERLAKIESDRLKIDENLRNNIDSMNEILSLIDECFRALQCFKEFRKIHKLRRYCSLRFRVPIGNLALGIYAWRLLGFVLIAVAVGLCFYFNSDKASNAPLQTVPVELKMGPPTILTSTLIKNKANKTEYVSVTCEGEFDEGYLKLFISNGGGMEVSESSSVSGGGEGGNYLYASGTVLSGEEYYVAEPKGMASDCHTTMTSNAPK